MEEDEAKRKREIERNKWKESDDELSEEFVPDENGNYALPKKIKEPKYDIIYSYPVDLGVRLNFFLNNMIFILSLGLLE